ncbi:MAG TPA: hypothetical protein VNP96_03175 [Solirubrobacterales bacterium]|nr:hypothetical protein [Solirubrobacterales bacterium]
MSRLRFPFVLLVIAALVALSTALVACGGSSDGDGSGDPQTVIDDASLEGIESGVIDLSLGVDAKGEEGGDLDVSLSGPFDAAMEEGEKPQFDLDADVSGTFGDDDIDFEGGLVLLPNSAYVNYQGTEYEVDPTTFSFVESALEEAQEGGEGGSAGVTGCQEAASGLKVASFIDNLKDEGNADVGGTSTTKVSGDLDVSGALDSVVELTEDPACKSQLGAAGPLPSKSEIDEAKGEVEEAVKTAHVDVYVGDDDIVRQITAQLTIEPPSGQGDGVQSVEIEFDLKLTEVNEEQEIAAPESAKPLNDLFLKLGVNPIELLGLLQGEGTEGLGGLLEGLGGVSGGSGGEESGGGASPQAYLDCLQSVKTAADLQKCARLR